MKISEKQKKFAEYYAESGNIFQSAVKAGYSENYAKTNAGKLLENDSIAEYLKSLTAPAQEKRILSAAERQEILSDIANNKMFFPADRIKAIDTLNKMTGEYTVKTNISGDLGVRIIEDV